MCYTTALLPYIKPFCEFYQLYFFDNRYKQKRLLCSFENEFYLLATLRMAAWGSSWPLCWWRSWVGLGCRWRIAWGPSAPPSSFSWTNPSQKEGNQVGRIGPQYNIFERQTSSLHTIPGWFWTWNNKNVQWKHFFSRILYFIIVTEGKFSASRAARGLKFWLQVALGPPIA